jgi:hypothetical protein
MITKGKIDPISLPIALHNKWTFNWDVLAYYQFSPEDGVLADSFRPQEGKVVQAISNTQSPVLFIDQSAKLFCDSLLLNPLQDLPTFTKGIDTTQTIPNFEFREKIGYTLSMWIRPSGDHGFSTGEFKGTRQMSFFTLDNVFSLWFDSDSSFRVYLFATKSYQETSSEPILIPVRSWINI